ncbi:transferase spermidine synthase [Massilia sp. Root351]|uniref:spermine/spermidine synthase domain-containing protein n=1 Tax=Massilia sp. Root351 TaxID=1736522 RepID=UPI00070EAC51|nr:transferase spermidine synthase [Massilia sp. Root351]KQV84782.1 transferase spermidine synthase [Massilia sp. Root351]
MPATLHHTAATAPAVPPAPGPAAPRVSTRGGLRTLEFQPGMVQSEMNLADPDQLVLSYARAMMCFVLFQPRPAHIVMVGLGGGSLAKFCYRYLPHSRITVLELRADVIALREQFAIPPDDERFRVIHADASRYMASLRAAADVLLVDGFDEDGLPPALGSAGFYADCRRALRPGGVLVANVFSYDPQYAAVLRRLRACFQQRVGSFHGIAGNNRLLFAIKPGAASGAAAAPTRAQRALLRAAHRRGPAWGLAHRLLAHWIVFRLRWLKAGHSSK